MRKNMYKILLLFFCCTIFSILTAQENKNLDKYTASANEIVTFYNTDNYEAIWDSIGKEIQSYTNHKDYIQYFETLKSKWGKIENFDKTPIEASEYYMFKTCFKKRKALILIGSTNVYKYKFISFLDTEPVKYPKITSKTTIDELLNPFIQTKEIVGLAVGIINNGKESTNFYGTVKKGTNKKPDINTVFEIGSITKTFTAIALLEMQKQGLLCINDPINKFIPANVKHLTYNNKEITLENLVTQNSGLPRMPTNFIETITNPENPYANYTAKDLYNFLNSYNLTRYIGLKYEYSNLGFGLLGHILALKAGASYEDVIKKEICDKLNMNDTRTKLSPLQKKRLAQGYSEEGKPVSYWDFLVLDGCGSLKSTINDMIKYLKANMTKNNSILSKAIQATHEVKYTNKNDGFDQASAWLVSKVAGHNLIWHNGRTGGFRSFIGFFQNSNTGIVILSNTAVYVDELAIKILERLALNLPEKK